MNTTQPTIEIRRADERGRTEAGWLHGRHSFSFGRYYDPSQMGYRALRVLNDDVVEPGGGFGTHPHDNMEILTWVLEGALRHADSTGTTGVIVPGDLQVMSAGRGIRHSEVNASDIERVHLLQIWIEPNELNLEPAYAQKAFARAKRQGRWQTLASPDGRDDSLPIHQDAVLSVAELEGGQHIEMALADERYGYLHLAFGAVDVGDARLAAGDAMKITGPGPPIVRAREKSQLLFFDLA